MTGLQVEHITSQDGRTLIYRLRGVLGDSTYAFDFLEELRTQAREGPDRIVINLEQVEYITSSGVGVVAAGYTSALRAEKFFALAAVPDGVKRVLNISGVYQAVRHYETEAEAVSAEA